MSNHTQGPWEYVASEQITCGSIKAKDSWVCIFVKDPNPENARLIAAAPDLLEALINALPMLHTGDELPMSYYADKQGVLGDALRAIAKAKGETNA